MTPLLIIADEGHAAIAMVLIRNGANVDVKDKKVTIYSYFISS